MEFFAFMDFAKNLIKINSLLGIRYARIDKNSIPAYTVAYIFFLNKEKQLEAWKEQQKIKDLE